MPRKAKHKPLTSKAKGDFVEDIVGLLHEEAGATVEKRIRLPSLKQGSRRKREIDVLITAEVAGYPVRLAIECKNEEKPVGTKRIDEFIGKLADVGIPLSYGIYVSSTGYTSAGLARALDAGIRPLKLDGLTPSRLEIAVTEALQSIVYLIATWAQISRFDEVEEDLSRGPFIRTILATDELGSGTPALLTHLWLLWVNERIPPLMGSHYIYIRLPDEFYFHGENKPFRKGIAVATVQVSGAVAMFSGQAKRISLRHAQTSKIEKMKLEAEFNEAPRTIRLANFYKEEELQSFLSSHPITLHQRLRVPRIISERTYWPPTVGALRRIQELKARGEEVSFEKVEGVSLSKAWEFVIGKEDDEDEHVVPLLRRSSV